MFAAIFCFTPLLVVMLGAVGLSAVTGWLDYVLVPALVVSVAFISPFRSERDMARALFDEGEFLEIHADVPLETAEARDPKGLYKKARKGELPHFTGIDSAYEPPESAEIVLPTAELSVDACVARILEVMEHTKIDS